MSALDCSGSHQELPSSECQQEFDCSSVGSDEMNTCSDNNNKDKGNSLQTIYKYKYFCLYKTM